MFDVDTYLEAEKELRKECDDMIENGELTVDEVEFRFMIHKNEILEAMPD